MKLVIDTSQIDIIDIHIKCPWCDGHGYFSGRNKIPVYKGSIICPLCKGVCKTTMSTAINFIGSRTRKLVSM